MRARFTTRDGAIAMSDIVERLWASLRLRAFDGDALERSVCAQQMSDAAMEIKRLRETLKRQKAEIVEWLEAQGQPGYASQIHHTRWGGSDE